jgi:glycosyl transferase family 2
VRTALDVVVPARDEQALLPRCLRALLWDAHDLSLRIVVAANGCADATGAAARRLVPAASELGHELVVLELPLAGKAAALNAASPYTRGCPVVFLDADTVLVPGTLRALAQALAARAPALLAAPRPLLVRPRTRAARSYAAVWRTLPAVAGDVIGAGCYAVNAAGRARWSEFPEVVADDAYVRSRFAREERRLAGGAFLLELPERRELVRVLSRWRRGNAQLRERFGVEADPSAGARRNAAHLAARPALWRHLPAFTALTAASRLRRPRAREAEAAWERADSVRVADSLRLADSRVADSLREETGGSTCLPPVRPRVHVVVVVADDSHDDADGCLASLRSSVAELAVTVVDDAWAACERDDADYVLLVRSDVRAAPDALDQLLALALRYPAAGLYGGRSVGGSRGEDAGAVPALVGSLLLVDRSLWTRLGGLEDRYRQSGEGGDLCVRARRAGATPMVTPLALYSHRGGALRTPGHRRPAHI